MSREELGRTMARGADLARGREAWVRREGAGVVSACTECRRSAVPHRTGWVHAEDTTPVCPQGMALAIWNVAVAVSRAAWLPAAG